MDETKKMNSIRKQKGYDQIFKGSGIDIGCGPDILSKEFFENIDSIIPYDQEHGDANHCSNLADDTFDFVYSSHCLEHMRDPVNALKNWIRICKPNGYIVVAVPHEVYYEKLIWPSVFNPDHKYSFRLENTTSMPKSINVNEMIKNLSNVKPVFTGLYLLNFDFSNFWQDQTLGEAVCQIEFILQKN